MYAARRVGRYFNSGGTGMVTFSEAAHSVPLARVTANPTFFHGLGVVAQGGDEHAPLTAIHDPEHGLGGAGSHQRLPLALGVAGVIVPGCGQHVEGPCRLPSQIRIQLVVGLREGGLA